MKIAIIGATGMIGHHTAIQVIGRGHELFVMHRKTSNLDSLSGLPFTALEADLNERDSMAEGLKQVDAVINCAGYYPGDPRPWQDEVDLATGQMKNFYDACSESILHRIVYLGTAIALKRDPSGKPGHADLEYTSRPSDKTPYVQVKWAMDQQARQAAESGLPVVIGIPSMTFGEYDYGPTTGQLITGIANQTLPGYVPGRRNVIYAGDAGLGLVLACESGDEGERYLFTGTNVSMDELVQAIATQAEVAPPRKVSMMAARMAGGIQAIKHRWFKAPPPRLSATAIAVMGSGQYLDGSKAEKALGFRATRNLEDTIRVTLKWFRQQGMAK